MEKFLVELATNEKILFNWICNKEITRTRMKNVSYSMFDPEYGFISVIVVRDLIFVIKRSVL